MRLLKKQQEEEERRRLEQERLAEQRKMVKVEQSATVQQSEDMQMAELRRQEEQRRLEKQRLEQMIYQESQMIKSGQVSKRSDDVHGLGWGNVTTGFVSKKKLGFLQRGFSMERDSHEGSPALGGFNSKQRGLRVTFAESPSGSRPGSGAGWTERVSEMDSQSLRAQTPPLAGEWAVSKGSKSQTSQMQISNGSSSLMQGSSSVSTSQQFSSSFQASQSSSFSSSQKTSFSSSQSSSFQSSSIQASKAFEAFPGMGGIENLKLEGGEN